MSQKEQLANARMALAMIVRLSGQGPTEDLFVRAVATIASEALAALGGPAPEAPPSSPAPRSTTPSTDRWRRWKERREALANALVTPPPTPTNALANVGANVGGVGASLSLISPESNTSREIERETANANAAPTLTNAKPTRIKHRFSQTLALDPDGDPLAFAEWCAKWGFAATDETVRKMARHFYASGKPWRDWAAVLRQWKSNERPSGTYPTRQPAVQPVPAAGRAWKVGQ